MRMDGEARSAYIKRKLGTRWPGLNGCDDLEVLIDEPELIFAIVKFGLEQEYQDQILEMQVQIADLQRTIKDIRLSQEFNTQSINSIKEKFSFAKLFSFLKKEN